MQKNVPQEKFDLFYYIWRLSFLLFNLIFSWEETLNRLTMFCLFIKICCIFKNGVNWPTISISSQMRRQWWSRTRIQINCTLWASATVKFETQKRIYRDAWKNHWAQPGKHLTKTKCDLQALIMTLKVRKGHKAQEETGFWHHKSRWIKYTDQNGIWNC